MLVKGATLPATSLNSSQHLNYADSTALVQMGTSDVEEHQTQLQVLLPATSGARP
jgi:hypothetical protein